MSDDFVLYQEILESTRDSEGVEHRDHAVKLLAETLETDADRIADFAMDRAQRVADRFDKSHKPETEDGQMRLNIDSYLVIGDNERVGVTRAKAQHTRQWIDIQETAKAKHDIAHGIKMLRARDLVAIQDEHNCSMWEAEQILRGDDD